MLSDSGQVEVANGCVRVWGSRPSAGGWLRHAARAGKENGCEWPCWPRGQVPSKDKRRGGLLIGEATGAGRERAFPSSPGGIWKEL